CKVLEEGYTVTSIKTRERFIMQKALGKFADDDFTRRKVPHQDGPLDKAGIPLCDARRFGLSGAPVYNAVAIAQYALAQHNLALEGNRKAEEIFMRCAQWLEDNAVEEAEGRFLIWPYNYPLRTPSVPAGWISGMAQGEGLSVLARSFYRTGSSRTAAVAERVAGSFLYSVEEGGVISKLSGGRCFIEEVAHPPVLHILNGCQVALIGLFEYVSVFKDTRLQSTLEACVQGVEDLLPRFDTGYWSLYSLGLRWHLSSRHYHRVHVRLFRDLGNLLNNIRFLNCADRWESYQLSMLNRIRHDTTEFVQLNARRTITILQLNSLKYRLA
ncbi:MAG: D-glucuronyl C5-epimerase family protein, partial [Acidobacteriota bacterium]